MPGPAREDQRYEHREVMARAAMEIWSEQGYPQVSVRNVARRTHLGHALVHRYFQSDDALVAACLRVVQDGPLVRFDFEAARTVVALSRAVADAVTDAVRHTPRRHRVRYDLRHQAQFTPGLREQAAEMEALARQWTTALRRRYESLGWQAGRLPFEFIALQVDARLERAVRERFLGGDPDVIAQSLRRDCLLILPG